MKTTDVSLGGRHVPSNLATFSKISFKIQIVNRYLQYPHQFSARQRPPTVPWDKITSPAAGSVTGTYVRVKGETGNIQLGQYVWPAVDLCWHKQHLPGNTGFITTIKEEGKEEPYRLALYVLTLTIHEHWMEWLDRERSGGLPMPPDDRRLAEVGLVLDCGGEG